MHLPLTGGCVCGAVRYEISRAPLLVYACHCTVCQHSTSSAFSIGVVVPEAAFRSTGAEARLAPGGTTENGRPKRRFICSDCGTWMFGNPRQSVHSPATIRIVRGGTLDDTSWLRPAEHYWMRSAQKWIVLPECATAYETQPW